MFCLFRFVVARKLVGQLSWNRALRSLKIEPMWLRSFDQIARDHFVFVVFYAQKKHWFHAIRLRRVCVNILCKIITLNCAYILTSLSTLASNVISVRVVHIVFCLFRQPPYVYAKYNIFVCCFWLLFFAGCRMPRRKRCCSLTKSFSISVHDYVCKRFYD